MQGMDIKQHKSMGNMNMEQSDPAAKTAEATGTVRKVNKDRGIVTIAHGPVPELDWPAMTMGFKATPEQLDQFKEADEVGFEFTSQGMSSTITTIEQL